MKSKTKFSVINPPMTFSLSICVLAFFGILLLVNTLFTPPPHIAMYVSVTIFVLIPTSILSIWTKAFKIDVYNEKIAVRKCLGFVKFDFSVSDITYVEWKTVETTIGLNKQITIFTTQGKKVRVESLMVNSDKMMNYIEQNVDESKMKRIHQAIK